MILLVLERAAYTGKQLFNTFVGLKIGKLWSKGR